MADRPDFFRIVLDPTRLRIVLREFRVGETLNASFPVEDENLRARRALVNRQNVTCHQHSSFRFIRHNKGHPKRREHFASRTLLRLSNSTRPSIWTYAMRRRTTFWDAPFTKRRVPFLSARRLRLSCA